MPSPSDVLSLIDRIRRITTEEERKSLLQSLAMTERTLVLSFINAHAVNLCAASEKTMSAFRASDVILRDGVGVKTALRALDRDPGLNMNGTDLIPLLLRSMPARRVALYGTSNPWLQRAADHIARTTPQHTIVGVHDGFHDAEHYATAAAAERPDLIILAMGMPRQEEVAELLKKRLDHPALIVNGGAILDFMAGRFERAPSLLQRTGLEWAFRLVQEPRRLFRRYVVGGFAFAHTIVTLRRTAAGTAATATAAYKEL